MLHWLTKWGSAHKANAARMRPERYTFLEITTRIVSNPVSFYWIIISNIYNMKKYNNVYKTIITAITLSYVLTVII